jgi:hypothetical protein
MSQMNKQTRVQAILVTAVLALLLTSVAQAATPGITGTSFTLNASYGYITQPDGALIYSWGYSCSTMSPQPTFLPAAVGGAMCPTMQIPGPTLVVTQNQAFQVILTNGLPAAAGNTSIIFTGATVTASGGAQGLLAREATPTSAVTYTVTYPTAGTHAYYSGTQSDFQIEMGLYGAVVVLPATSANTGASNANCSAMNADIGQQLGGRSTEFRLAPAAYDHPEACYDREYLFQWTELDPRIHRQAEEQVAAIAACAPTATTAAPCPTLAVATEPYRPAYFMINGRSMPDNMDANYAPNYPNQPYNADPHMHPGDLVLIRTIGQGHMQHPFHEHANHVRILARDGNLIVSQNDAVVPARLAGRMEFDTDTTPGQAFDGIFYWSGKGLGWDIYGHTVPTFNTLIARASEVGTTVTITTGLPLPAGVAVGRQVTISGLSPAVHNGTFTILSVSPGANCNGTGTPSAPGNCVLTYHDAHTGLAAYPPPNTANPQTASIAVQVTGPGDETSACHPDANGYYTVHSFPAASASTRNYYEWCADHNHPLETNPVGEVGAGGPMTLPDPLIMTNGLWYNGTPYLGPDAVGRSRGPTPLPPSSTTMNPPIESGIAFMWHSHNEREITTNDVFPGGMLMMMLVDPPTFGIDETL